MYYTNYVSLYDSLMKGNMWGAVLFAYNYTQDVLNRTCTITGRVIVKAYDGRIGWSDPESSKSGFNVQYWFAKETNLKINNITFNNKTGAGATIHNASWYNSHLGTSDTAITEVDTTGYKGGRTTSTEYGNVWYGGFYALTDEWTWTLPYGDNTTANFQMTGQLGSSSNWSAWYYPSLSGVLRLPYLENRSIMYSSSNDGNSWTKNAFVWKTDDYGNTWTKVDIFETADSGTTWDKIR